MVGALLYVAQWTRPDISYSVSELSRFVSNPGKVHLELAKRDFFYLAKTSSLRLKYSPSAITDNLRSTSGYVLMLNGAAVFWLCKPLSVFAAFVQC